MIVVDVLLALNLVLFVVCALRAPRSRPSIDDLVAAARLPGPKLAPQPVRVASDNIVPFRSRDQLEAAHAKQLHPSSWAHR